MSVNSFSVARHICERGNWNVTNLKLQKILYLAHMAYMGEHNGQPLIDGGFEAWDYGPVQPKVYRRVSMFGRDPIRDVFQRSPVLEDATVIRSLNKYIDELITKTPGELVAITHWEDGAWAKKYIPGRLGIDIPNEDILDEYRARAAQTTQHAV